MIRDLALLSRTFSRVTVLRTSMLWHVFYQQTIFNTEAKERILIRPRPGPRQPMSFRDCFSRTKVWAGHLHQPLSVLLFSIPLPQIGAPASTLTGSSDLLMLPCRRQVENMVQVRRPKKNTTFHMLA